MLCRPSYRPVSWRKLRNTLHCLQRVWVWNIACVLNISFSKSYGKIMAMHWLKESQERRYQYHVLALELMISFYRAYWTPFITSGNHLLLMARTTGVHVNVRKLCNKILNWSKKSDKNCSFWMLILWPNHHVLFSQNHFWLARYWTITILP